MNLPNKLSLIRIILVPIILVFMLPIAGATAWNSFVANYGMIIALILFAVAAYTDHLDGKIARRDNLITDLGKLLDPIADKFLVITVFMAFAYLGRISVWIPVVVTFRELAVTGLRSLAASKNIIISSKMFGKVKAVVQMFTIIFLMLENIFYNYFTANTFLSVFTIIINISLILTIILTILSGFEYFYKYRDLLKE